MKKLYLLLCCLFLAAIANSQGISVIDLPTQRKLPVNAIHRPFQDREGYMWYGTVDGLCRDDGYNIQVFRSDIFTPGLLKDNSVGSIAESSSGNIWFGTDKGAYILNKSNYTVHALDEKVIGEKQIFNIFSTRDGSMWISCYAVLFRYNEKEELLDSIPIKYNGEDNYINGFCEGPYGDLFVTIADRQIFRLDRESHEFLPYDNPLNARFSKIIYDAERESFWVGIWHGDALVQFNPYASDENYYTYYSYSPVEERVDLYDFLIDEVYGDVWVLNCSELKRYKVDDENKRLVQKSQGELPHNSMMAMMFHRGENLWLTTFDRPSFLIQLKESFAKYYDLPALKNRIKENPALMCICQDSGSLFWMMQERSGLYLYDLATNEIKGFREYPELRRLPLHSGREMAKSKIYEGIWFVNDLSQSLFGLSYKNAMMKLEDRLNLQEIMSVTEFITQLYEDKRGLLWIGSTAGIYVYDIKKRKILRCLSEAGHVTDIKEDWNGMIWICTADKGIYQSSENWDIVSLKDSSFHNYSCLSVGPDGILWFGTNEGGVYAYNPESGVWVDYNQVCRLNGDRINQIVLDGYNHVWIGTNQKLMEFNPKNNASQSYLTSDETVGLKRFLPTAACVSEDGSIYWGGIPGLFKVSPSNMLDRNNSSVCTTITDIKAMGKPLYVDWKQSLPEIEIDSKGKNLEFYFSTLNHRYASQIRYAYRLSGVDEDWNYTLNGQNVAVYTNLNKGTYLLEVKATDEHGIWSKKVTSLVIHRLPEFYESIWAYLLYSFIVFILLSYLLMAYIKRIKRKNEELWKDSEEMVMMKRYLDSKISKQEKEFIELDKVLLDKATQIVEENLSDPEFDVNKLSEAMCMSRSTFTRKIKAITGLVPLDFIRRIKMEHAKRLLKDPDRNVTEIATILGYHNRKYFTSCFKDEFGMSPSEYRKNCYFD